MAKKKRKCKCEHKKRDTELIVTSGFPYADRGPARPMPRSMGRRR
jgi:hypothetical protein